MNDPSLTHRVESDPVLALFINSVTDQAVFTLDPNGIITTWNEGCVRLKRYTPEEAIGQHFRMLYTEEDRAIGHPEHNLRKARQEGQFHEERVRLRKGGEPFEAEVSIYSLEKDGHFGGFAKIVKDVTERVRLERERTAFEERLVRSNRELEGFCHSVAHDLRAPIRAIVSRSRFVQEDYADELPQTGRGELESLAQAGLHLSRLVEDLLAFAQLGQGDIERDDVDLSEMTRRIANEILPQCHAGNAHVKIEEGVRALADPSLLELVVRNLIENACKYSNEGVRIEFAAEHRDGEPVYVVRDNGIGFEKADAERVFEPFTRLRNEAIPGTGIGLANVRRIVERHGGRVWAESEPGQGTTFSFTLGTATP